MRKLVLDFTEEEYEKIFSDRKLYEFQGGTAAGPDGWILRQVCQRGLQTIAENMPKIRGGTKIEPKSQSKSRKET